MPIYNCGMVFTTHVKWKTTITNLVYVTLNENFLVWNKHANQQACHVIWLHVIVFTEHDLLHFWDNYHLLNYYPVKVHQNCFNSFNCSNQTDIQVSKFPFVLDKLKKTDLKFL